MSHAQDKKLELVVLGSVRSFRFIPLRPKIKKKRSSFIKFLKIVYFPIYVGLYETVRVFIYDYADAWRLKKVAAGLERPCTCIYAYMIHQRGNSHNR